ncbi:ABC transporter permease [Arsenicicoccus sp. UBA7492]|uniref:ABC transporter permease n=1 Tax=Arsenicicoccus sp. UBA7492 TaxID=1946057 RepID=UPI00257AC7AA|nr:ABC transporter permease [Arsenicicoccus sp. UBA7492]
MTTPTVVPSTNPATALLLARVSRSTTWLLLAVAIGLSAVLQPDFFSAYSIASSFSGFLPLVLLAVGQAVVIIGGGLDLSLGASLGLASVVGLLVMDGQDGRLPLGILAALATGLACGLVNGLIVAVVRLQPLITTFATASIFIGATLWVLPKPGGTVPAALTTSLRMAVAGLPVTLLLTLLLGLSWLLLRRTRFMRHVYAIGGDVQASYASLVPVTRTQISTYAFAGTFAGLAAVAVLANSGSGDPYVGGDFALNSVAAVVIGGVALRGGEGGAIGAIAGAVVLSLVSSILFFLSIPTTYRQLAQGLVVIGALALSALSARGQEAA